MRGNETNRGKRSPLIEFVFTIPMRGNELGNTSAAIGSRAGFTIPMRGNENLKLPDELWLAASLRSP